MASTFTPVNNKYISINGEGVTRWAILWEQVEIDYNRSSEPTIRIWWDKKMKAKMLPKRTHYVTKKLNAIQKKRKDQLIDQLEHSKTKAFGAMGEETENTYIAMIQHINGLVEDTEYLKGLKINELAKLWEMVVTNSGRSTKNTKTSTVSLTGDDLKELANNQQNTFESLVMTEYGKKPTKSTSTQQLTEQAIPILQDHVDAVDAICPDILATQGDIIEV